MRGQFILIMLAYILIAVAQILFSLNNHKYTVYETNIIKYIAYNFYRDIQEEPNITVRLQINHTYYDLCRSLGIYCIYNTTDIVVKSATKFYRFKIE